MKTIDEFVKQEIKQLKEFKKEYKQKHKNPDQKRNQWYWLGGYTFFVNSKIKE